MKEIVFNPQERYTWQTDDKFTITGQQLDNLFKTSALLISSDITNTQVLLRVIEALSIGKDILKAEVEAGNIKAAPQEPLPEGLPGDLEKI